MSIVEGYRLSGIQQQLWARGIVEENPSIALRVVLDGNVQRERVVEAINTVVTRHEALRLKLEEHPGLRVPLQTVDDDFVVDVIDSERDLPEPSLLAGRPVTASLVSLPGGGQELLIRASPLVVDQASLSIVASEVLAVCYAVPLDDDDERLQFLDISEWQLEQAELAASKESRSRADSPRYLAVPFPPEQSPVRGVDTLTVELTASQTCELRRVAEEHGCSGESPLLGAWILAVSRYFEDDTVPTLAWYDEGRSIAETTDVVGPLSGFRHVPLPACRPLGVWQSITMVNEAIAGAEEEPPRIASSKDDNEIPPIGFACVNQSVPVQATHLSIGSPAPAGKLHLGCECGDDSIGLTLSFDTALYTHAGAQRLLDSVYAILTNLLVARSDSEIRVSGTAEKKILAAWSQQGGAPATDDTLSSLLDRGLADASPTAPAVVAEDGTASFADLDEAASALCGRLMDLDLAAESPVLVLADRSWRTVAAFVGILRAGASYVPVDPQSPEERVRQLADLVGARIIVGSSILLDSLTALGNHFTMAALEDLRTAEDRRVRSVDVAATRAAYVIFTSGSTGVPRPVVVEHRSAAHLFHALNQVVYADYPTGLRVSVNAPLTFDASIKQIIQLCAGHTLCLIPESIRQDGPGMLDYLSDNEVDVLDCTPSHLRAVLSARDVSRSAALPRLLLIGGEAIDPLLWETLTAIKGTRAINVYGPTETTVDVSAAQITEGSVPSIGYPLPGVRLWVLDEHLRTVPAGVAGELCVAGPQVARGYLGDEQATARRFVHVTIHDEPFVVYRTGDRVRHLADGRLEYLGRTDDQVKVRGHRIEPGEVEATLSRHPGVDTVAVLARHDDTAGSSTLAAYAVSAATGLGAVDPAHVEGFNAHETRYLYDEIFVQGTYLRGSVVLRENAIVFDVGANIGMFSLFVHALCPDAQLYAFEPLPEVFAKLKHNVSSQDVPVTLYEHGLSERDEEVSFTYYPGYTMMSGQRSYSDSSAEIDVIKTYLSNAKERADDSAGQLLEKADELLEDRFHASTVNCRLRRLSDILDETAVSKIDLLKVDVQRAELDVLRGLDDRHWKYIQQVVMEVHDATGTPTEGRLDDVTDLLEQRGFDVVIEQDELLRGTDRYSLYGVRPEYAQDPRPILATEETLRATSVDEKALEDWLRERLPHYLVPDEIMLLDELPRTDNGKLDRAALREITPQRTPSSPVVDADGPVEKVLVEAWREVLNVDAVGVEDSFFELGGDSIRAIQLQVAAARRGVSFSLRDVFVHPTIRDLVRACEVQLDDSVSAEEDTAPYTEAFSLLSEEDRKLLPTGVEDAYPMSSIQLGMVYHSELATDPGTYHVMTVHKFSLPLDEDALRTALHRTVAAHPILRTSFDIGSFSVPMQCVHANVKIDFDVDDIAARNSTEQEEAIGHRVEREIARRLEVDCAPILRLHVFRTGDSSFQLVLRHYHALLDGWSLRLLIDELMRRYVQALGRSVKTAPEFREQEAMPYRRFVELEQKARKSPEARRFWLENLAGAAPLHLARSVEGGRALTDPQTVPKITSLRRTTLPEGLGERLLEVAEYYELPLKSLLLAAHVRAQGEENDRHDVVTGLVFGARPGEEGSDRTLGMFLNTLPLRMKLRKESLLDLARRLWRAEADVMGAHVLPLADVEQAVGRGPLFDVFFNFTRFHLLESEKELDHPIEEGEERATDVAFSLAVDFEVDPADSAMQLVFQYDGRRLSDERVDAMIQRYMRLLNKLSDSPTEPLTLPVDTPEGQASGVVVSPIDSWSDRVNDVWRELLGSPARTEHLDFFEAGGDSLLALRLVAALRRRYEVPITLPELLAEPRFSILVEHCVRFTDGETVTSND